MSNWDKERKTHLKEGGPGERARKDREKDRRDGLFSGKGRDNEMKGYVPPQAEAAKKNREKATREVIRAAKDSMTPVDNVKQAKSMIRDLKVDSQEIIGDSDPSNPSDRKLIAKEKAFLSRLKTVRPEDLVSKLKGKIKGFDD